MKLQVLVKCNDGTQFKIEWVKKQEYYELFYRNDIKGVETVLGNIIKKKWTHLYVDSMYSGTLSIMFEEIGRIDASEGA